VAKGNRRAIEIETDIPACYLTMLLGRPRRDETKVYSHLEHQNTPSGKPAQPNNRRHRRGRYASRPAPVHGAP
jgi:hypothetical protein